MTGAINLSMYTLYIEITSSMIILISYLALVCTFVCVLFAQKIAIKFW